MNSYEEIIERAKTDESFREGLRVAAEVCKAQGASGNLCPSGVAEVYLRRLANGEMP